MKRIFLVTGLTALGFLLTVELIPITLVSVLIYVFAAAGLISAAVRYILGLKHKKGNYPASKSLFEILITVCITLCLFGNLYLHEETKFRKVMTQYESSTVTASFIITSEKEYSENGYPYFTAKPISGMDTEGFSVRIYGREIPETEIYDYIHGSFAVMSSDPEYYLMNRADGTVLSLFCDTVETAENENRPLGYYVTELRRYVENTATKYFGKAHGFVKALLLGDRSDLESEEYTSLKNSGLLHVTAVSGLHVGIAAATILSLLAFVKKPWLKYCGTVLLLLLLGAVTGFSPSVIRSVAMLFAGYMGNLLLRKADALNVLGLILTLCLLFSPFSAYSPSLLLSFSATFGLILFSAPLQRSLTTLYFKATGKYLKSFGRTVFSTFSVSVSCLLFTLPVSQFLFGEFTFAGLLTNILCLWLIKYIFIGAAITVVLGNFTFLAPFFTVVSLLINWSVEYFMAISDFFSETFLSELSADPTTIILSAVIGYVVYLLMGTQKSKKERRRKSRQVTRVLVGVISAVLVLMTTSIAQKVATPADDKLHTVFVDVGQGLGTYVSINDTAIIFDCGGSKDAGEEMNESLRAHGIQEIDYIVISHLHDDHANGIEAIFENWEIDEVIIPYTEGDPSILVELTALAAEEGAEILMISEDMSRTFGDAEIELLTEHLDPTSSDQNENSIVSAISLVNYRVLMTGDITKEAEARLVDAYGYSLRSTVLCVPHHGSKHSSSEEFLQHVSPLLSVVSVGANSYGHPTEEALTRLLAHGDVLSTMDMGDIEIVTDGVDTEVLK